MSETTTVTDVKKELEEHQLWLVQVAHLGQLLKLLAQQVQQERGVHLG